MQRVRGMTLLDARDGDGPIAKQGDRVRFSIRLYLNRGDEVPLHASQASQVAPESIRVADGVELIDRIITIGRREAIPGVEYALTGMSVGGYRKVRIGPHLAYGDAGVLNLIPPNAVLVCELWLREVLPLPERIGSQE